MKLFKLPSETLSYISFKLSTLKNPKELQEFKAALFKDEKALAQYQWSTLGENHTYEAKTKDIAFALIPVHLNPGLIVIDVDLEDSIKLIETNLRPTLTHTTLRGKHYYYKAPQELTDSDLDLLKSVKSLRIDIFTSANKHIVYEGANTNYYAYEDNGIIDPIELTAAEFDFLLSLQETTKQSVLKDSRLFYNNALIAKEAYRILENDLDPLEVNLIINRHNDYGNFEDYIEGSGRNNLLLRLLGRYGSSGYMKSQEDLKSLILKFNSYLALPLEEEEIEQTIFQKSKLNSFVYEQEALILAEQESIVANKDSIPEYFIGINLSSSKAQTQYVLVDTRNNRLEVIEINSAKQIDLYASRRNYAKLHDLHYSAHYDKNNELVYAFNQSKCPTVRILYKELNSPKIFTWDGDILEIHTGYYNYNPKIQQKLDAATTYSPAEIIRRVAKTRQFQVISRNLIPNQALFIKWAGDLSYVMKTKTYLRNALVIKDIKGSTGKDSVFTNFLSTILLGKTTFPNYACPENLLYSSAYEGSASVISCASFLHDNFIELSNSPLMIFNEDGELKANEIDVFNQKFKSIIKSPMLRIREMHKMAYAKKSNLYVVRYTNTVGDILSPGDTNTRIYVSHAKQEISLKEWNTMFPNENVEMTEEEIDAWLDFLIYIDFENDKALGYPGFAVLPPQDDEFHDQEDLNALILNQEKTFTPSRDAAQALEHFINLNDKTINVEACKQIDKDHIMYPIAQQLLVGIVPKSEMIDIDLERYPCKCQMVKLFKKAGFSPGKHWAASIERYFGAKASKSRLKLRYRETDLEGET